jgi:hypothetical protein
LSLNSADPINGTLGSLVRIAVDTSGTSLVSVNGPATLAGILEIVLDPLAVPGTYVVLTSIGIAGVFDSVDITGVSATPLYSIQYHPTYVEFVFTGFAPPPAPLPQFSAGSVDFGARTVGSASQSSVTLSNTGNGDLTVTGFGISGAFTATDNCPATLAPSASCAVQITFSPSSIGNHSSVLSLISNAAGAPTVTLSGSGTAEPPVAQYQVTALVTVGVGTVSPATVLVAEGQTQTFTVTPAAGYSISSVSGCGGTLSGNLFTTAAISQPCAINVTFAVLVTAKAKRGGGSMNFLALGGLLIALLSQLIRRRGGIALITKDRSGPSPFRH